MQSVLCIPPSDCGGRADPVRLFFFRIIFFFPKRKSNKKWRPIVKNHFFFGVTPSHFSFDVHTGNNITQKKKNL